MSLWTVGKINQFFLYILDDVVEGGVFSTDPGRLRSTPSMKALSARITGTLDFATGSVKYAGCACAILLLKKARELHMETWLSHTLRLFGTFIYR